MSCYQRICQAANIMPFDQNIELDSFSNKLDFTDKSISERLTAGLQTLIYFMAEEKEQQITIDSIRLNYYIAKIDEVLNEQINTILHQPEFQQLESLWRSLHYLIEHIDQHTNIQLELLDISKQELKDDFSQSHHVTQAGLYHHIYHQEYDMPGGEPYTAMISPYLFSSQATDIKLLENIAEVACSAHCPFIAAVDEQFFGKGSLNEVINTDDLFSYLDNVEFIPWNQFRDKQQARYIGLTLPKFLLRLPYGEQSPIKSFVYQETIAKHNDYLWTSASYAFAINLVNSFTKYGWCSNIRGPESGGKITDLPLHQYDIGHGLQYKIPLEILISESQELTLAKLGFIPLSYYKNTSNACFFSANSTQKPIVYHSAIATANSRLNTSLPCIFLSSRIAHYLKVLQREHIGASNDSFKLADQLNTWLKTLVTKMNHPDAETAANYPLKEGRVEVKAIADNPGFYQVELFIVPHLHMEGMEVRLALVTQLPRETETSNE